MYQRKKIIQEYERQASLRKGWEILRDVVGLISISKVKKDPTLLDDFEATLIGKLRENGIRDHKAINLYKQNASHMKRKKCYEHGLTTLWLLAIKRA
jgi:hypothetical protein